MAIRKNKETNAVLTRLNSELQQQLKVSLFPCSSWWLPVKCFAKAVCVSLRELLNVHCPPPPLGNWNERPALQVLDSTFKGCLIDTHCSFKSNMSVKQ